MKIKNMVNQVLRLLNGIVVLGLGGRERRQDWPEYCLFNPVWFPPRLVTPALDLVAQRPLRGQVRAFPLSSRPKPPQT